MKFSKKHGDDLERELRAARPVPRSEYVTLLSSRLSPAKAPARFRPALAAAVLIALLVPFAAFGGVGMTATAVKQAVTAVAPLSAKETKAAAHSAAAKDFAKAAAAAAAKDEQGKASPATDEYGKKCGQGDHGKTPGKDDKPCPPTAGGGKK